MIIVGAWNPAIVQPTWLSQRKVVEASEAQNVSANPFTKGFYFEIDGVAWHVDEQRLQIWSPGKLDTGIYAARVLNLLSHTPVQAMGTNFYFQTIAQDWPADKAPRIGNWDLEDAPPEQQFEQFVWSGTKKMGADTTCKITVTRGTGEAVALHLNLHRDVDATRAAQFAGAWKADWAAVREIVHQVLGIHANE